MARTLSVLCLSLIFALPVNAHSQDVAELIRKGDAAAAALHPDSALQHFEAAIAADSLNAEAYWKAASNAVDLGEFEPDKARKEELFALAERYARRGVQLDSGSADARFHLARSLGVAALTKGVGERVKYATEVRVQALAALELDSLHPGALHVLGVWNAEVMRLSFAERLIAKAFLGGGVFSQASWEDAIRLMEKAVQVDPERLTHHLDLARIYRDRKMRDEARREYRVVLDKPALYFADPHYKAQAEAELARIKS